MSGRRSVVIHGHFYQPPRENPWTGVVEREPNAAPDHDWNARITRECYAPLASIPLGDGADPPRINAYNFLSFNVGATLLTWLEREAPVTYQAMLSGDRAGHERVGRGNAIAQPYHHIILPLASRRDKQLEVRWGMADFRRRFGREPLGMWLPETAVDQETLDVLAEEGIIFTVLAPHQVTQPPTSGRAGRLKTSGGRSIAAFIYDGALAHDVAFGKLLKDAAAWEKALLADATRSLVSIATDGETYGHHHRYADLCLGALLQHLAMRRHIRIENYASALVVHPPQDHLTLVEPSSWSCAHGIERWRADCGCCSTQDGSTQQRWRAPLRAAIDWLVTEVHAVADRSGAADGEPVLTALAALTSCGWFFDDFAGLEGRQVLRYAARAIALCGDDAPRLEAGLLARLDGALSNDPKAGTAVAFYLERIKPEQPGVTEPLRFVFGLHLHQPVGNFDHVFREHVRDVYRPILERTAAAGFGPLTVHVSGPIFDWLEAHDTVYLDLLGRMAAAGQLELLLAGFDEPILASLPRDDRLEQVFRMREYLHRRFGVTATGLWLTERVWEPELAADLAQAGVGYALVDDRHFLATGFRREQLHQPWRTESDGRAVSLLAIDERLRYLIPFRPPEETAAYLRQLRAEGHRLAVLADDGEKFGGWPGTLKWVYEDGWLDHFLRVMGDLTASGEVRVCTGADAMREVPSGGLAYLPTASYREMEGWSLPAPAQQRLVALEGELGDDRLRGPDGGLVRGGHWRNFLVKYAESNRMHKTMVTLSALSRGRGDPPVARRAIGRAQCNDAYWHGVFGGLYLPILRNAIWRQLAIAEGELRRGESLACDRGDYDGDGADELYVHASAFAAVISPRRGGAIEVFTRFAEEANLADALTRRREAYHPANGDAPPADLDVRALLVDRVLPGDLTAEAYARADYRPAASWADTTMAAQLHSRGAELEIELQGGGLEKRLVFTAAGALRASYRWNPAVLPADGFFAPELSLSRDVAVVAPGADIWRYPITTVAKSERGLEETEQGVAITPRWPVSLGEAQLEIPAP